MDTLQCFRNNVSFYASASQNGMAKRSTRRATRSSSPFLGQRKLYLQRSRFNERSMNTSGRRVLRYTCEWAFTPASR